MIESLTIGRLADDTGVPTSTLRYYERAGLLQPAGRTDGNYRVYTSDARVRVRFIRVAQAAGFSLEDIRALLDFESSVRAPCDEVEALIERRLVEVRTKLRDLREIDRHLKTLLELCRTSDPDRSCKVLDRLSTETAGRD